MLNLPLCAIIVPQGAEYQAVCRGLRQARASRPVFPVPVGWQPLRRSLETLKRDRLDALQPQVLVMGLCGSLSPRYPVGDSVIYQSCVAQSCITQSSTDQCGGPEKHEALLCDKTLTQRLQEILDVKQVRALTSDRVICTPAEKQALGQAFDADVVDMEGAIALESLTQVGISVAMLRVVSDDCDHAIPNLNSALRADGSLNSLDMITQFAKEPIAAMRLIRGAIQGLNRLQAVTTSLFTATANLD
jgi:Phosphorylase superfamily